MGARISQRLVRIDARRGHADKVGRGQPPTGRSGHTGRHPQTHTNPR